MRAGWGYFDSFPQAAKDFAQLSQTRLTMPVLSIGGEKSLGAVLAEQMKLVASDVTVVVLKNTGHWLLEENPKETTDALIRFLGNYLTPVVASNAEGMLSNTLCLYPNSSSAFAGRIRSHL